MKKQLLILLATLSLSTVPISVLAQESNSSNVEMTIVDEGVLIETYDAVYRQETKDYTAMLSNIVHNADVKSNVEAENVEAEKVDNQLILDYVQKLIKYEIASEEAAILQQKLVELSESKVALKDLISNMDESERLGLSQATLAYLEQMQGLLLTEEGDIYTLATNEQIEMTWQLVKVAKEYGFILEDNKEKFESLSLDLGAAEFHRLVTTSFNDDGSFKDKLYSKHLTELYNLLKDKKSDFVKEYQARYVNILKEIEARKDADEAVKQIEEKRAKGESVSEEEIKKVEEAVAKVQTQSHRETIQTTKEAVVTSQTNNIPYEKPVVKPDEKTQNQTASNTKTNGSSESTQPKPQQPKDQPKPVEPTPTPQSVEPESTPPASEAYQIPAGFFATFEEADSYGYSVLDGLNVTSFQTYTAGFLPDGTPYFGVHLINSYAE
ncbi:hypothetical protein NHG29_03065 [Aerococcaceae bacterium NML160702]|nr:hypothetical protein [Aerococcaceae bacterium NML160702]